MTQSNDRLYRRELFTMTCSECAGTGTKLNPQVYVEWGNPSSGELPLSTTCECTTTQTTTAEDRDDDTDD